MKNIAVVIPSLDPDSRLPEYVRTLQAEGIQTVIVINDGSDASCAPVYAELEKLPGVHLLRHEVNQGKGRALKDAFSWYLQQHLEDSCIGVVTADSDGQHTAADVLRTAEVLRQHPDALVLGERAFDRDVPLRSRFGNTCTAVLFRLLYHAKVRDTQTGLRGIPNRLLPDMCGIEGDRYEYEMMMLVHAARNKIPMESLTIQTIYENNNAGSHFHTFRDSWRIYRLLLGSFIRFGMSSLASALCDLGLFQIFVWMLRPSLASYISVSTILARIGSSLLNFGLNRKLVFHSRENMGKTAVRYYLLAAVQMLASAGLVTALHGRLGWAESGIKIVVDSVLFLISYRIQKRFVFGSGK